MGFIWIRDRTFSVLHGQACDHWPSERVTSDVRHVIRLHVQDLR